MHSSRVARDVPVPDIFGISLRARGTRCRGIPEIRGCVTITVVGVELYSPTLEPSRDDDVGPTVPGLDNPPLLD